MKFGSGSSTSRARARPRLLVVSVPGVPVPQGSMRSPRPGLVLHASGPKLEAWRGDVALLTRAAARRTGWRLEPGEAAEVTTSFFLPRPRSVSPAARPLPIVPPDGDKLTRAVWDALTASGVIADDAVIARWSGSKVYADDGEPGLVLEVGRVQA